MVAGSRRWCAGRCLHHEVSLFRSGRRESFEFIAEASPSPSSTFSSNVPSRAGTSNLSSFPNRLSPPPRFGRRGGVPPAQRFVRPAPPDVARTYSGSSPPSPTSTFFLEAFVGDDGGLRTAFFDRLRAAASWGAARTRRRRRRRPPAVGRWEG